jgi:hypothetical protein
MGHLHLSRRPCRQITVCADDDEGSRPGRRRRSLLGTRCRNDGTSIPMRWTSLTSKEAATPDYVQRAAHTNNVCAITPRPRGRNDMSR